MKYALLIYASEASQANMSEAEAGALYQAYNTFSEDVTKRGVFASGEALQPTTTATTVRVRDGKTLVTDGPFAETKEQLGGFYILECKDLDEATAFAAKIPGAKAGSIEVRPVMVFSA